MIIFRDHIRLNTTKGRVVPFRFCSVIRLRRELGLLIWSAQMIVQFDLSTGKAKIPVGGNVDAFVIEVDPFGKSKVVDLTGCQWTEVSSLHDPDTLKQALLCIELCSSGKKSWLFGDGEPDEGSEIVYVSVPKNVRKQGQIVIHKDDHASLQYAIDLLIEGELDNLYKLEVPKSRL